MVEALRCRRERGRKLNGHEANSQREISPSMTYLTWGVLAIPAAAVPNASSDSVPDMGDELGDLAAFLSDARPQVRCPRLLRSRSCR